MRERVEVEVDEKGRLWVSQTLGERLGLASGMVLVVSEEGAANRAYWSIQRQEGREKAKPSLEGGGLLRTEGALKEDVYWDQIMEEVQEERKKERGAGGER